MNFPYMSMYGVFMEFKSWEEEVKRYFGDLYFLRNNSIVDTLINHTNFDNCKLCNISSQKVTDSSKKDLIIGFLFNNLFSNVLTFVRTLRSTNSKCSILFFCDKDYQNEINQRELQEINNCGVTWCVLDTINTTLVRDPRVLRRLLEFFFLRRFNSFFNRVLIVDVADTMFQKDPFTNSLPSDKLTLSIERVQFGAHDWMMQRNNDTDPFRFNYDFWYFKYIINSGLIYGPSNIVYDLYSQMMRPSIFLNPKCDDQSLLDMTYYYGYFTYVHIDFPGIYFSSAAYSVFEEKRREDNFIYELNRKDAPHVIHQYDRICQVTKHLEETCTRLGDWQTEPYGRDNYYMQFCGNNYSTNDAGVLMPTNMLRNSIIIIVVLVSIELSILYCFARFYNALCMKRVNKRVFHAVQA